MTLVAIIPDHVSLRRDGSGETIPLLRLGVPVLYWACVFSTAVHDLQDAYVKAWLGYLGTMGWPMRETNRDLKRMDEIDRDSEITINVGFGNITFCRDETGTFAKAIVDIADANKPADRIEMTIAVPADPRTSIIDVVEQSRLHIIAMLQAAIDRMEAESAESLIYR